MIILYEVYNLTCLLRASRFI